MQNRNPEVIATAWQNFIFYVFSPEFPYLLPSQRDEIEIDPGWI